MRPARIVIVDDHPLIREGLAARISRAPDLEVRGEAAGVDEALKVIGEQLADLVLVDISLQQGNGLALIREVARRWPQTRTLVVSMHEESLYGQRARRAGAVGYLNKQAVPERIVEVIHRLLAGGEFFADGAATTDTDGGVGSLSNRELQIFELLGRGFRAKNIAEQLHISVRTVEAHRENIKIKLDLHSAHELTLQAIQWVED